MKATGTDVQVLPCLHMGRTGAVGSAELCAITRRKMRSTMFSTALSRCMKYRNRLGHGEHPLAHRQSGEYVVSEMRRRLHQASCGA
jgi:hypothetical protein